MWNFKTHSSCSPPQAYSTADPRALLTYTSAICRQGHETACEPFDFKTIVAYLDRCCNIYKSIIHWILLFRWSIIIGMPNKNHGNRLQILVERLVKSTENDSIHIHLLCWKHTYRKTTRMKFWILPFEMLTWITTECPTAQGLFICGRK